MKRLWGRPLAAVVVSVSLLAGAQAQSVEREGVKLEPTVQVGNATLQLNGAGVRTRMIFKVYVGALYVPQKSNSPAALLAQKGPRRISLTMLRDVDADTFADTLDEGLKNNHSEAQLGSLKAQIEAFNATMRAVKEVKKGDIIHLDFLPGTGTRVSVNGQSKGTPVSSDDFYIALLRIWLGDKPADSELKKGMLGS